MVLMGAVIGLFVVLRTPGDVRRLAQLHTDRGAKSPADRLRLGRPGSRADALSAVSRRIGTARSAISSVAVASPVAVLR
jgi:hypothetical protein